MGLYDGIRRDTHSTNISEMMTNKDHLALYCVDPKLSQHIRSMFVSNYFVFRLEI